MQALDDTSNPTTCNPLILDEIVTPISEPTCNCSPMAGPSCCKQQLEIARKERDNALLIARQYRDLAETSRTERRREKYELEQKVELVRNFWRNKIIEGNSRSGQMLRAALLKK